LLVNFDEYAAHLVVRLRRQVAASGDGDLGALLHEVLGYEAVHRAVRNAAVGAGDGHPGAALPMVLRLDSGERLSFFSTMTVFGSPLDVRVEELAIESFFPADEATAAAVRALAS
jgi:hypothetical protein